MEPNSRKRKGSQSFGKSDGSIETRYEEIISENKKLKKELVDANAAAGALYIENNKLKICQSNDDDDIDEDMKEELKRMKDVAAELNAELEETHTKMEDERKLFGDEIDALNTAAVTRDNKINELEEQLSALKDVKGELEAKHEDEKKEYEAKLNELKSKNDNLTQKITVSAAEAQKKIEFRDNEIKELQEQLSNVKDVKLELGTKYDTLEEERATFQQKNNDMKLHVDELTQNCDEWKANADEARKIIGARDNEIKELNKQLTAAKLVKEKLTKMNSESDAEITDLKLRVDGLTKKNDEFERTNKKKIQDMKNEQQKTQTKCENQMKELEGQLQKTKKELDSRCTELKQKEDKANVTISDLKKTIRDLEAKNASSTSGNRELQSIVDNEDCLWMKECRTALNQFLHEYAKRSLFQRYKNEDFEEVLKKFEERKYASPNEFLSPLTQLFCNLPDVNGVPQRARRLFEKEFQPIIEKFTPAQTKNVTPAPAKNVTPTKNGTPAPSKNEEPRSQPRRSAALKAPAAWQSQLEYL